jgi:signal transduction histidine kinase
MKLFPKLALSVSALLIVSILGLSGAFYLSQQRAIRQQMDQERRSLLNNLVHIAQESFLTNDDLLLVKYTGLMQKWNPALISASVDSVNGEILAHSEPGRIGKSISENEPAATEVLVLSEPVRMGTHVIAAATVSFSQRFYDELLRERFAILQRRIAQVALAALSCGLLISFLIALSWTRPIGSLVKAAGRIGEGKYELELAATDRRADELGFLANAFQEMAERLRELDTMKEDFVSAVTHELRSPLGAIESYLNLIADELKDGLSEESWRLYLERLRVNTQRLTRFVNDLLDVAAFERGKIVLQSQATSLPLLAREVAGLYAAQSVEKKIALNVLPSAELPEVHADAEKIRQVLINLISNAMKFTPAGGRVDIFFEHLKNEKVVRVSVQDSGMGIASHDQSKIFNKFEQVHGARRQIKGPKGTGLGLAICKALVELHGGTLSVRSQVGEGSIFFFVLPLGAALPLQRRETSPA